MRAHSETTCKFGTLSKSNHFNMPFKKIFWINKTFICTRLYYCCYYYVVLNRATNASV